MKLLILGCNGMAGHLISLYFKEKGHEVIGIARTKSKFIPTVEMDIKNLTLLKNEIDNGQYDAVINCIGVLNQSAEEDIENSIFINSYLPHYLVKITKDINTKIIHMSTDCVFSGEKGGYTERDFTDGKTYYDRTKALGEINDDKNITLRTSIIGPDINKGGIGLFNWFMKQTDTVSGYSKAIWTGQTTLQLAKTMETVLIKGGTGLVNVVPNTSINKYDLLKLFNKYARDNELQVVVNDTLEIDKSLVRTNYEVDVLVPPYEVMVEEMVEWIKHHKEIYWY